MQFKIQILKQAVAFPIFLNMSGFVKASTMMVSKKPPPKAVKKKSLCLFSETRDGFPYVGVIDGGGTNMTNYSDLGEYYLLVRPGAEARNMEGEPPFAFAYSLPIRSELREVSVSVPVPGVGSYKNFGPEDKTSLALFLYAVRMFVSITQGYSSVGTRLVIEKRQGTSGNFYALEIGPYSAMEQEKLLESEEMEMLVDLYRDWIFIAGNSPIKHPEYHVPPVAPPMRINYKLFGQLLTGSNLVPSVYTKPLVFATVKQHLEMYQLRKTLLGIKEAFADEGIEIEGASDFDSLDRYHIGRDDSYDYHGMKDRYLECSQKIKNLINPKARSNRHLYGAIHVFQRNRSNKKITDFFHA